MTREASADTRSRKSGHGATDLVDPLATRRLPASVGPPTCSRRHRPRPPPTRFRRSWCGSSDVIETLSSQRSSWTRADVLQAICDQQRPVSQHPGRRWAATLEQATDQVVGRLVDLDPPSATTRRGSDGRSVWIEPTAPRFTSEPVLAREEAILIWAMAAQADPPAPSTTIDRDWSRPVAGRRRRGRRRPRRAGVDRRSGRGRQDPHARRRRQRSPRPRSGRVRSCADREGSTYRRTRHRHRGGHGRQVAPRVAAHRPTTLPRYRLPVGATLVIDEAGMLSTPALHQLVSLADRQQWRLALVGDPRQLQGVGRGGLLGELCANGRVEQLEHLHRFTHSWEAAASLQLRRGRPTRPRRLPGARQDHRRHPRRPPRTGSPPPGSIHNDSGRSIAVVASTNDHVNPINHAIQAARRDAGHLDTAVDDTCRRRRVRLRR